MRKFINGISIMVLCSAFLFTGCNSKKKVVDQEYIALEEYKSFCGELAVHSEIDGDYSRIYYYDYKSGKEIFACGQANCSHQSSDYIAGKINCNAVIEGEVQYPFVYQSKLYYFVVNSNNSVLWKSNTDGTQKEIVAELEFAINNCESAFVKGNVYITCSNVEETEGEMNKSYISNTRTEIYKVDIGKGNVEQITDMGEKAESNIKYIRYFDNKLFFVYSSSQKSYEEAGFDGADDYLKWMASDNFTYKKDIELLGKTEKCYTYDLDTKKVERIDIDFESNFEPYKGIDDMDTYYVLGYANDTMYYLNSVVGKYAIYSYNIKTKERKEVLSCFKLVDAYKDNKIYVTGMDMDEKTKDELIPSADLNKEPTYYIIDVKTGSVTKQDYGVEGKILYVVDANKEGLIAYIKDFDAMYDTLDEHSMCTIGGEKIKQ
ncbi:MAG: hypothetical protein ACLRZ9_01370 [Eubacterium sp.]